jgi:hypothetical protein
MQWAELLAVVTAVMLGKQLAVYWVVQLVEQKVARWVESTAAWMVALLAA